MEMFCAFVKKHNFNHKCSLLEQGEALLGGDCADVIGMLLDFTIQTRNDRFPNILYRDGYNRVVHPENKKLWEK